MFPEEITIRVRPRSLLIGVCFSPVIVLVGWWVCSWPWGSDSAVDWVQAVGSIGAILVAAWAAIHASQSQFRVQEKVRLQRGEIASKTLADMARRGSQFAVIIFEIYEMGALSPKKSQARTALEFWEEDLRRARSISPLELPDSEMVDLYWLLTRNLEMAARYLQNYLTTQTMGDKTGEMSMGFKLVLNTLQSVRDGFEGHQKHFGDAARL